MIISGPNAEVKRFIADVADGEHLVKDSVELHNSSEDLRMLIQVLYPGVKVKTKRKMIQ